MLQCTHPIETCARRDWYSAIRNVLSQRTDDAEVLGAIMACWADNDDGNIHTAGDDQERGWRVPRLKSVGNGGHWEFDHYSDVPTFDCNAPFDGDADGDCDDSADEPSDGTHAAEKRSGTPSSNPPTEPLEDGRGGTELDSLQNGWDEERTWGMKTV